MFNSYVSLLEGRLDDDGTLNANIPIPWSQKCVYQCISPSRPRFLGVCLIEGRRDCEESSVKGLATVLGIKEKCAHVPTVSSSKMFNAGPSWDKAKKEVGGQWSTPGITPSASSPKEALQPVQLDREHHHFFELGWGNDGGMIGIQGPRDPGTHRQFFSVQIAAPSPPDLRALEFPHHSCDVDLAVLQRPWPAKWAQQGSKMKQNASGLKPRAPKNLFGALKLKTWSQRIEVKEQHQLRFRTLSDSWVNQMTHSHIQSTSILGAKAKEAGGTTWDHDPIEDWWG